MPNRSAAIVQKWRRIMAVGCTHGDLADIAAQNEVLAFKERWKPDIRFDLGDLVDTAAFRSGARGTPDEGKQVEPDEFASLRWIERYEPTHITYGNHCQRLVEMQRSQNAIVAYAAGKLWNSITEAARKVKAKTKEYDFEDGWFEIGGTFWGHGYFFNEAAVRDHAEMLGGPVVMAHLHRALQENGRTLFGSKSFCVGLLGDPRKMTYARRRRATSRWSKGCVFGEVSDRSSHLWLASSKPGEPLHFPI